MLKVFPNDRDYTYEAIVEQLNLIELDLRDGSYRVCKTTTDKLIDQLGLIELHFHDGSWKECKCNPEKHMPTIIGLAKRGIKTSDLSTEREYYTALRKEGLQFKRRLDEGQLTDEEAVELSDWATLNIEVLKNMRSKSGRCESLTEDSLSKLSGLASEGIGFTESSDEKSFMSNMRDNADSFAHSFSKGKVSNKMAENMREWSRDQRRRVARKKWVGDLPKTSRQDEEGNQNMGISSPKPKPKPAPKPELKPEKKKKTKKKRTARPKDDEDCPTCTVIPDKYKKKATIVGKDYEMVQVTSRQNDEEFSFVSVV